MKFRNGYIALMALFGMLFSMPQTFASKQEKRRHESSSSSHHTKKCCKEEIKLLEGISRTASQDLIVDTNTNVVVQQINRAVQQDLAVDQEILNIVNEILNEECLPIYQTTINDAGGTLTLTESGKYCLAEDVVGTIVIASSGVCLDLSCHTLDADGADNAILVQGTPITTNAAKTNWSLYGNLKEGTDVAAARKRPFLALAAAMNEEVTIDLSSLVGETQMTRPAFRIAEARDALISDLHHISIGNGTVVGAVDAAILIDTCFDVSLFDLTMLENALDSIRVVDSNAVSVVKCSFLGDTKGERALSFTGSDNLTVSEIVAQAFATTLGGIIQFEDCHALSISDVDVSFNTSTPDVRVDWLDPGSSLVVFSGCTGTHLYRVRVDNNTFTDENIAPNGRSHEALYFFFCSVGSLTDCSTSNNIDMTGSTVQDTDNFICAFLGCDNFIVTNFQSNKNETPETIFTFVQILAADSNNMVFDGAQANSSTVAAYTNGVNSILVGAFFNSTNDVHDNILRNCQANENVLTNALINSFHVGIHSQGADVIFDGCQTSNNVVGNATGNLIGLVPSFSRNAIIENCTANNNTGSSNAAGIVVHGGNLKVLNCLASRNGNSGMQLGVFSGSSDPLTNIEVIDCVVNDNGTSTGAARGINFSAGTNNIFIKGCQINNTGTASSSAALGIRVVSASKDIVIEDTVVTNTSSSTTGVGISFTGVTNGNIFRSQVLDSKSQGIQTSGTCANIVIDGCYAINNGSNGFELSSATTNSLVQNNVALSNAGTGFVDTTASQNAWLGNKAQNNTTGYSGVAAGNISTYTKSTGAYAGGSAPNIYSTTNLIIQ